MSFDEHANLRTDAAKDAWICAEPQCDASPRTAADLNVSD
jgi:hypothetical protein